ncbi:MAG: hypothetical protein COX65_05045 [Elusimicrobia bacterium CG_4_10_14_0_2_um_filter_56_8]|nr:MAG: hypothetical protein COX65_05045 [Elusimicrobia bacterium CG_4_10_14_0_2_um_filter_56_8]
MRILAFTIKTRFDIVLDFIFKSVKGRFGDDKTDVGVFFIDAGIINPAFVATNGGLDSLSEFLHLTGFKIGAKAGFEEFARVAGRSGLDPSGNFGLNGIRGTRSATRVLAVRNTYLR